MLPIEEALPPLKQALSVNNVAVLVAPPGAGKTTVTPLALMDEPWTAGRKVIVLEPRRLAARAAAARMASPLAEPIGDRVGFRVRLQTKVSERTQIEVVTEGVFTRMILSDPGLQDTAAVLFDEFHERSLDADLGLALARDAQKVLRPDLRLLVMSATLDGALIASKLQNAPVIESRGRSFSVDTRYLGRDPGQRIEDQTARAVRKVLAEEAGGLLVFLPGQREILRTWELLQPQLPDHIRIAPLYGALSVAEQDWALSPAPSGIRKVVLATAIAETSLTIEGVRVVIDSGLARTARYDPASGLTRLQTGRASRAAADQRRGRAGRTEPGVCYRIWDETETRYLSPFSTPEILESDLSGLALDLAAWGAGEGGELTFLDPPPKGALAQARQLLTSLDALDVDGHITPHGRRLSQMALPPRLAQLVVQGAAAGAGQKSARIAALLSEHQLGGSSIDLDDRLTFLQSDRSHRGQDSRALAARWARQAGSGAGDRATVSAGRLLIEAYPERVAQRRGGAGEFRLSNGRGAALDPGDPLSKQPWIVVAELSAGSGARDQIRLAAAIERQELLGALQDQLEICEEVTLDAGGRVRARRSRRLGALVIDEEDLPLNAGHLTQALMDQVRRDGLQIIPWSEEALSLRARVAFLRALAFDVPDLSDEALMESLALWLTPLLEGHRAVAAIDKAALGQALFNLIPWDARSRLDQWAPSRFQAPTGSSFPIDYTDQGGPKAEVRVQELFGLGVHPLLADGRAPLVLALLSPAHRPLQLTKDLPGFWRGSWADVRREMRGRYPKHPWPEDPMTAAPTTRTKPRGA